MISPVLIGGFVEKDKALLYMPCIGKKDKEYLEQKVCKLTFKVNQDVAMQSPRKTSVRAAKTLKDIFGGTPCR